MSNLKQNNRWKVDNNEKNKFNNRNYKKKQREPVISREVIKKNKKETFDLNSEELFPVIVPVNKSNNVENNYLEKIKLQIEKDNEKNINRLKEGWVCYKKNKQTRKIVVSRNGIDYFNSLEETYSEKEREEMERQDLNKRLEVFQQELDLMYLRDKQRSEEYYYETGKLDAFAQVERENLEYEKYLKKFDECQPVEEEFYESESDDSYNLSDDEYNYKR